ncbi:MULTISPECIES: FISUMP domain-containing protein [unclassified Fibrobacter]|uniref:FISUMP domain-containing protein n=1 Tax=unclassified Fibrobacter TaxID=2634177 RepID=UPI0025BA25D7|nr:MULTISPECIES: FISUMP domain-containing protein [unclassified Fibrobacter]
MKHSVFRHLPGLCVLATTTIFFTACSDDDDFSPVSKNRGYDYAFKSNNGFADYPCNEMREGREAIVGRDKESYFCEFDEIDSVYIWAGYNDTLTAKGKEFVRKNVSSSSRESSSSGDDDSSSSQYSSSYSSSSYSSSSSSARSSSSSLSWEELKPRLTEKGEQFNPDIDYGTMTDPRDGKTYRTVDIEGTIWMAENLNYTGHEVGKSYCFKGDEDICKLYGRFYSRDAAMNSSKCEYGASCLLGNDPIQGICPDGWHIPTYSETQTLVTLAGKKAQPLMSTIGWGTEDSLYINPGIDTYGLSFVGTGQYDTKDGYNDIGEFTFMWVYYQSSDMYYLLIRGKDNEAFINDFDGYESNFSVRCVKGDGVVPVSSSESSSSAKSSSSVSSSSVSSSSRTKQAGAEPLLEAADEQFNPDIEYGTMTDSRDGKTYKTVKVGSATWMAENLNYAGNEIGVSTCFNDDDRFCELYGHFYSRSAAMNSSSCAYKSSCDLGTGHIQGICPDGWHIPTNKEAQDLVNLASGHALPLMSAKGWKTGITPGTDTYGLSFVGAGCYCSDDGFHSLGEYGRLWVYYASSTQYYIVIRGLENEAEVWDYNDEECYNPVRCVKD